MTLTISRSYDNSYITVWSRDKRLRDYSLSDFDGDRTYFVNIPSRDIYAGLQSLASFVNNQLDEEMLLEVD